MTGRFERAIYFFFLTCFKVRFKACKELDRFSHVKA